MVIKATDRLLECTRCSDFDWVWLQSQNLHTRLRYKYKGSIHLPFLKIVSSIHSISKLVVLSNPIHSFHDAVSSNSPSLIFHYFLARLHLPIKMINILPFALVGILATAATSSPFIHKRQDGQQVVFRSDLKQGMGQSPEFKNVYCKPKENSVVSSDL